MNPRSSPIRAAPLPAHDHDSAFVALYEQLRPRLVRLATLLVDRQEIAEELVQEAFAVTYRDWARLDEPGAYARTALVYRCRSELRRREVRRRHPLGPVAADAGRGDHLRDVVARLPERQRTVVVLRFYEDLRLDEIGRVLGIRTGTVKSTLHRALARLRKEIQP